jgi:hypothetical protein
MLSPARSKTTMKVSTRKSCCIQIYCNARRVQLYSEYESEVLRCQLPPWPRGLGADSFKRTKPAKKGMDTIGFRDELKILRLDIDHDEGVSSSWVYCT